MKKIMLHIVLLLALSLGAIASGGAEEKSILGSYSSDAPIEIASDRLEGNDQTGTAKFSGTVVAKQGDVTIYAEELDVYYQTGSRLIEKVVALNGVRIVQGERIATGDKAVFFNQQGKVVLTGEPKVHQGQDFVQGDEITVFLNEERSVVTGKEGARVNALFHPQGEKQ
ncbi:MAG: lipopolysaccharide transport periplasmic protein LptA [Desulfuromonadaceae bacterium GWC2_58_13]|nr:MAG: lipopolysaccharide transport periplasmic protein LptA [Desulfuromonadaceae bacterium GWC2_58_13]